MLYATKFYQNCVDEDTESRWMEAYEEQKNFEQTSHGLIFCKIINDNYFKLSFVNNFGLV